MHRSDNIYVRRTPDAIQTPAEKSSTPKIKVPTIPTAAARSLLFDDGEVRVSAKMHPEKVESQLREKPKGSVKSSKKSEAMHERSRDFCDEENDSDDLNESDDEADAAI